jgi:hypothetical protein
MSRRVAVRVTALAFAAAFAFTTVVAQATTAVAGIDIVVKKKPGGAIVAHGTTGRNGSVDLGNLPRGQYELTLALPKGASTATQVKTADVTISGATAPVKAGWDYEKGFEIGGILNGRERAAFQDSVPFATDGQHHVVVVVSAQSTAVNSSRSNIKNNLQIYVAPSPTPTPNHTSPK